MSDDLDYNSESDEDFCPDKVAGESVSEEEESGDEEEPCSENKKAASTKKKQTATKRRKRANDKKPTKSKKSKKSTDDDDDDDDDDDGDFVQTRRISTRHGPPPSVEEKKHEKESALEWTADETERTDSLWAEFLSDTKPTTSTSAATTTKTETNGKSEKKEEAKKVTVTETLNFAGEEVRVEKTLSAESVTPKAAAKSPAGGLGLKRGPVAMRSSTGGLGSLLSQIGKKKKMTVLEKSQLDWNSFKQDEGIDEELQTHNKGKDGYLERQDFLQRTDLRQFEIEKSLRQGRRKL